MANIPTPHIEVKDKELFAKTVLMPGDPLRAEYIANKYLTDVKKINSVRNMFAFTGYYNGKKVTVMGSGMGQPSIGIYSYELFQFYGVEKIIRIGSCGSYVKECDVYDVIVADEAYSESSFAEIAYGYKEHIMHANPELLEEIKASAKRLGIKIHSGRIHSSDVFYRLNGDVFKDVVEPQGVLAVEMESYALYATAKALGKKAACILTVSDSFITHAVTTSEERHKKLNDMVEIALGSIEE